MRRGPVLIAVACLAASLVTPPSRAGTATADVYRSHFLARDRTGSTYSIEAVLEDRPGGAQLVIEIAQRCASCRPQVYAKALRPGDVVVNQLGVANPECQCMSARVTTKFGGKKMTIDWAWDPEQGGAPAGDGYEWTAVSANNIVNVSCYGTGSVTSTPDPASGEAPAPPDGARAFPKKMPGPFKADWVAQPGCHVDSP